MPYKCPCCNKYFPREMSVCPHCGDRSSKITKMMMTSTYNPLDDVIARYPKTVPRSYKEGLSRMRKKLEMFA